MIAANVAMQIVVGSPLHEIDQPKRGIIINGRTGEVEPAERKLASIERCSYRDGLLKRADEVVDTISITHHLVRV